MVFQSNAIGKAKVVHICLHVLLNYMARNMLSRLDTKSRFVHREVAILIRAQHIVRLEAFVQTVLGPYSANRASSFQQEHIVAGIDLAVGLDGGEPAPTYW